MPAFPWFLLSGFISLLYHLSHLGPGIFGMGGYLSPRMAPHFLVFGLWIVRVSCNSIFSPPSSTSISLHLGCLFSHYPHLSFVRAHIIAIAVTILELFLRIIPSCPPSCYRTRHSSYLLLSTTTPSLPLPRHLLDAS